MYKAEQQKIDMEIEHTKFVDRKLPWFLEDQTYFKRYRKKWLELKPIII